MFVIPCGLLAKQERQAPDSNQCEWQIGRYIAKIGNAEETTVIRKLMVGKWLWNARDQTTGKGDYSREYDQNSQACSSRDQSHSPRECQPRAPKHKIHRASPDLPLWARMA
jgi:hypothetical protein